MLGLLRQDVRMAEALVPQDHLYTLVERGGGDPRPQIVGSIIDYRLAHDRPAAAAELAADPGVAILSLTITEAGYGDGAAAPRHRRRRRSTSSPWASSDGASRAIRH